MDPRPHADPPDPSAAELFVGLLERRERGEEVDLEELCQLHPEAAAELRRLHEEWYRIRFLLELRGVAGALAGSGGGGEEAARLAPEEPAGERRGSEDSAVLLGRLGERGRTEKRYRLQGEVARGGQGAILHVWDEDLRRDLAMKVALGDGMRVDRRSLARFLEEAQVTGQLDHPGIVPVHELGLDGDGRVYFTMKLVRGRDLRKIFELVHRGKEGWTVTRALGVMLKVCEAMAFAHDKGVIHRDLKPGNVMVGEYGEVYVMDWGLAQVLGSEDAKDIRIRPEPQVLTPEAFHTAPTTPPDSPLITMDGHVVGTPSYMSPEQAMGDVEAMGPHSDVYSLGSMLYQLFSGRMPYVPTDSDVNNYAIWYEVQVGPPLPLRTLAPDVPEELVAICDKAMAREPSERYATMQKLAEDLRAYLENRVVGAYEYGTAAVLRKWVQRNRGLAAASACALVLLVVGLVASLYLRGKAEHQRVLAQENAIDFKRERDNVLRLSALTRLEDLRTDADELWPIRPELVPEYEAWLERARALVAGLYPDPAHDDIGHLARLDQLRARGRPLEPSEDEASSRPLRARLEALSTKLESERRAHDVRTGASQPQVPELDAAVMDLDARALADRAWPLVDPDRTQFDREPEGLGLARRAMELVDDDATYLRAGRVLAWAEHANGLDDEARSTLDEVVEAAPPDRREGLASERARLDVTIEAARDRGERVIAELESQVAALEQELVPRRRWAFDDDDERWWHAQLERLVGEIQAFADDATGLMGSGIAAGHGWGVAKRLDFARELQRRAGDDQAVWAEAIRSIADREECPAYRGLRIGPQVGLLPLGRDALSGFWEFAHLETGAPPERDEDGRLVVTEDTGLVFVLVPGGAFLMGAQADRPEEPGYDPAAFEDEGPVHEVRLSPFLVSKFEMTQAQWARATGEDPSYWTPERSPGYVESRTHPVEQVDWFVSSTVLARLGLALPSEARWEYAARGGTTTPYWTGASSGTLRGGENLADQAAVRLTVVAAGGFRWDDGYAAHAPVGSFRANPFGLHDLLGNVAEWCLDVHGEAFYGRAAALDPVNENPLVTTRVVRGQAYNGDLVGARVSYRQHDAPEHASAILGLRPVRELD